MSFENHTKLKLSAGLLGLALVSAACAGGSGSANQLTVPLANGQKATVDFSKPIDKTFLCNTLVSLVPDAAGFTPEIHATEEGAKGANPDFRDNYTVGREEDSHMTVRCSAVADPSADSFYVIGGDLPIGSRTIGKDDEYSKLYFYTQDEDTSSQSYWNVSRVDGGRQSSPEVFPSAQEVNEALCGKNGIAVGFDPNFINGANPSDFSPTAQMYCAVAVAA